MQIFRNTSTYWQGRIKQAPEYAVIASEHLHARLDWLDKELANRTYMAGDRFTVADITAFCAIDLGKASKIRLPAEVHPNLVAWYARCAERPSAKA